MFRSGFALGDLATSTDQTFAHHFCMFNHLRYRNVSFKHHLENCTKVSSLITNVTAAAGIRVCHYVGTTIIISTAATCCDWQITVQIVQATFTVTLSSLYHFVKY